MTNRIASRCGLCLLVVALASCEKSESSKQAEPKPQVTEKRSPVKQTVKKVDPPPTVVPDKEPDPKPKEPSETAKSLLEKGRQQCKRGDFILAEQTWLKGLDLCGDDREDQMRKAEMYLRIGLVKEHLMRVANFDPFKPNKSGIDQKQTLMYYERFNDILIKVGIDPGSKQLEIQHDQNEIIVESRK